MCIHVEKKSEKEVKLEVERGERETETDRHARFNKNLLVHIGICFQCRIWKSH